MKIFCDYNISYIFEVTMISSRMICIYWGYKGRPQWTIWYFYRVVSITKMAQNCINFSQIDRETNCLNRRVCLQKGEKVLGVERITSCFLIKCVSIGLMFNLGLYFHSPKNCLGKGAVGIKNALTRGRIARE